MSETYLQLASIHLDKSQSTAARSSALMSMMYAMRFLFAKSDLNRFPIPYRWCTAFQLVFLTFLGSHLAHLLLRARRYLIGSTPPLSDES